MRTFIAITLIIISTASLASQNTSFRLKPFSMKVQAQTFKPVKAKAKGTISLKKCTSKADSTLDLWCYNVDTKIKIAEVHQLAKFKETKTHIKSWYMQQKDRAFWKRTFSSATFDYNQKTIKTTADKSTQSQTLTDTIFDDASYPLQIQKLIQSNNTEFELDILVGHKIKTFKFKVIGKETLFTQAGILETIKVEQLYRNSKVLIWFAKKWDYLPVQFETYKSNKLQSRVSATSVTY